MIRAGETLRLSQASCGSPSAAASTAFRVAISSSPPRPTAAASLNRRSGLMPSANRVKGFLGNYVQDVLACLARLRALADLAPDQRRGQVRELDQRRQ